MAENATENWLKDRRKAMKRNSIKWFRYPGTPHSPKVEVGEHGVKHIELHLPLIHWPTDGEIQMPVDSGWLTVTKENGRQYRVNLKYVESHDLPKRADND